MPIIVTTPATNYPVTLAQAKAQCHIDSSDEDEHLIGLIAQAVAHVENYCGRSFSAQTLTAYIDTFADEIQLLRGPVTAVSSVKYYDTSGVLQTLDASVYQADLFGEPATVSLKQGQSWPAIETRKNAVQIAYTVGETAPLPVVRAMLLLIGQWQNGREAVTVGDTATEIPNGVAALLANERSFGF